MHSLEILFLGSGNASPSEGLPLSPGVNLQISAHGRATFIAPLRRPSHAVAGGCGAFDCSAEPAPEGRNIVAVFVFCVVFWCFAVGGSLAATGSAISA